MRQNDPMWLFTQSGFYSIVQKQPDEFHIRSRRQGDLENLKRLAAIEADIIVTRDADYRYRLIVTRSQAVSAVTALAEDLDYGNFKGKVSATPDQQSKLGVYHKIWSVMHGSQEEPGE